MKAVILAGGSGERFWPLSTIETPKQFLTLFGETTLIEQTYERIRMRFDPKDIIIITSRDHSERTRELLRDLPGENVIGEPVRRNTAPACAAGALASGRDEILLVVPADHRIPDPENFWKAFDTGMNVLNKRGGLLTFGIEPSRADTGYGYIESGDRITDGVFDVKRFVEKPDGPAAEEMLRKGGFFWNSGMFMWKAGEFLDELKRCSPDIMDPMEALDPRDPSQMEMVYPNLPSRSVDYAVMEISSRIMMISGSFEWSDVGNWSSIQELEGYSVDDQYKILVDSERIFVRSGINRPVGIIGLEGVIVIDSENGLLICSEKHVQKVREISRRLSRGK